mmetsp:Transcript_29421/g.41966  ORF Transcript_29421/g.41966 Transcript_29421/m.41966 type:complete len:223 (-) Transcript_29421:602-1270(-)
MNWQSPGLRCKCPLPTASASRAFPPLGLRFLSILVLLSANSLHQHRFQTLLQPLQPQAVSDVSATLLGQLHELVASNGQVHAAAVRMSEHELQDGGGVAVDEVVDAGVVEHGQAVVCALQQQGQGLCQLLAAPALVPPEPQRAGQEGAALQQRHLQLRHQVAQVQRRGVAALESLEEAALHRPRFCGPHTAANGEQRHERCGHGLHVCEQDPAEVQSDIPAG